MAFGNRIRKVRNAAQQTCWCPCLSLTQRVGAEMENHSLDRCLNVWVVFLFSCPVPNFPCNSFRRPRVINSVIQGCYSYSEHFLDSWDLAFTLVLPLPVRLRSIILRNHLKPFLKSSEHRTGFLKLCGKTFILPKKTPWRLFLFSSWRVFYISTVRCEHPDFLGRQLLKTCRSSGIW